MSRTTPPHANGNMIIPWMSNLRLFCSLSNLIFFSFPGARGSHQVLIAEGNSKWIRNDRTTTREGPPMELHEHRPVSIRRCLSNVRKAADQSSHLAPCRGCPDFV